MTKQAGVTVQMLMEYLSKYPPYYRVILYQPPYNEGYRVMAPTVSKDNPWMYSTRAVYLPMKAVKAMTLPKYNTYRKGTDGRTTRFTNQRKQRDRLVGQ